MFKDDSKQQAITKTTIGIFGVGLTLLMLQLILTSLKISSLAAPTVKTVSVGPLSLIEIAKQPIDGGFTASFQLLPGLNWYFGLLLLAALVAGIFMARSKAKLS